MTIRALSRIVALACLTAPAASAQDKPIKLTTTTDKFTGRTSTATEWTSLAGGSAIEHERFQVRLFAEADSTYTLMLRYQGRDWVFIEDGGSLMFLADSTRVTLESSDGSTPHREVGRSHVAEAAFYKMSPSDVATLAKAQAVDVRIIGSRRVEERRFKGPTFELFRGFLNQVVVLQHPDASRP